MNLLVISNAYPSKQSKYAGIFVKNQVEWMKKQSAFNVDCFFMKLTYTSGFRSFKKYFMAYLRFLKFYKKKYSVLHIHFLSPLIVLPFIYKFIYPSAKTVITMHGGDINNLENRLLIWIYRFLINKIDVVICVGEVMRSKIEIKLKRKVDHVLCAGINDKVIQPQEKKFADREIDFLYVGSFLYQKGIDRIIKALEIIDHKNMRFVFIGNGKYQKHIKRVDSNATIEVINDLEQSELSDYYNNSKFFIFMSRGEGFGLALAEAMYCKTPAIISDLDQLKFQVTDGENGYVCHNVTPSNLSNLMKRAYNIDNMEWNRLSKNAGESAKKYSLESVCKKLKTIYLK